MDISTRRRVHAIDADLRRELIRSLAMPVGGGTAIGLAIALIPLRDHVSRPVALLPFAILVLVASLVGGPLAGCVAAMVAGMAVDSFLHEPYGTLSLSQGAFWSSTVALVVVALVAGAPARRDHTG